MKPYLRNIYALHIFRKNISSCEQRADAIHRSASTPANDNVALEYGDVRRCDKLQMHRSRLLFETCPDQTWPTLCCMSSCYSSTNGHIYCECRLVAQEKGLTRLTITFTLIFVKPVNFVIKKAIENGTTFIYCACTAGVDSKALTPS